MSRQLVFVLLLMLGQTSYAAAGKAQEPKAAAKSLVELPRNPRQDPLVEIDFAGPEAEKEAKAKAAADSEGDLFNAPPIELFFQNPALQASLSGGIDELNRSVENLMDSIFYAIMDNKSDLYVNDFAWFSAALTRKLYSAPSGAYVVFDRFNFGPRYSRALWHMQDVPITLGIDGSVEVEQIYLRTDGMRVAQERDMSTVRRLANNWFGLVPALTAVLPPSFNQNHLYDPITELMTPFSFPLSVDSFHTMPIGSIRSYALSGGVRVTPDVGGLVDRSSLDILKTIGGFREGIPYSVFMTGEHRINVLRRDEDTAWVGVNNIKRVGQGLSAFLGQRFFLLHGSIMVQALGKTLQWAGVPAPILPINIQIEKALAKLFDQVYEFDLRQPAAQEAYRAAVKGDFAPAYERYLDRKEKNIVTGVKFLFNRDQTRSEDIASNGPNLAFYRNERRRTLDDSAIEITDEEGKFHVLEATHNVEDKEWNLLVGEKQVRTQQTVEMKVNKIAHKADDPDKAINYAFEIGPNPYHLQLTLNVQDRFVDTLSLVNYLDALRFFTGLPMDGLPSFPDRDADKEAKWRQENFFASPYEQVSRIHVTPTYLGKFSAQAGLYFTKDQLQMMIHSSDDQMWVAFALAFGMDKEIWGTVAGRASDTFQAQWFKAFFSYPLRMINLRYPTLDAVHEASKAIAALQALKNLETPEDLLLGFRRLLDTDHPEQLTAALLHLVPLSQVSRKATLSAQPQSQTSAKVKTAFGMMNNKTFRAGPRFPLGDRYARAKTTLSKFYLNEPREQEIRPKIMKIQVTSREVPKAIRSLEADVMQISGAPTLDHSGKHVFMNFNAINVSTLAPLQVYVRIEEAGRLKLGKLTLAEKVVELPPLEKPLNVRSEQAYEVYLTGPLSPLNNEGLSGVVADGDDLRVVMAVSADGATWSDERSLSFSFRNGNLFPVK